jgi:hypothetical protein
MPVAVVSKEEENHVASAIKPARPYCSCTAWDPLPLLPFCCGRWQTSPQFLLKNESIQKHAEIETQILFVA